MAIVDNGIFIRNAVLNHDVSDNTIRKIKRLVSDKNPMPISLYIITRKCFPVMNKFFHKIATSKK